VALQPAVLFLDDDDDLRSVFIELLRETYDIGCVSAASMDDLVRQRNEALRSKLALLDVNLGETRESGLDAYAWLRSQGYEGKVVFMTGHAASDPNVQRVLGMSGPRVLRKPVPWETLTELIGEIRK
jgi:DNA-binding NtrC family response regulator